jgi:hypothetical protein
MAPITIFAIAFTVLLLLLIQRLTVSILLSSDYRIAIDYSFVTLILKNGKRPKKKRRIGRLSSIKHLTRALIRIISTSKITVNQLKIPDIDTDPFKAAIAIGGAGFGMYSILGFILSKAHAVDVANEPVQIDREASVLDIVFETKLYNILFSGIILLYEEFKGRIIGYARKSNQ